MSSLLRLNHSLHRPPQVDRSLALNSSKAFPLIFIAREWPLAPRVDLTPVPLNRWGSSVVATHHYLFVTLNLSPEIGTETNIG